LTRAPSDETDTVTKLSPYTFDETVARLLKLLEAKTLKLFGVIDQRAEARRVGLELRETTLVLFGNPKAGTPIMDAAPIAALDLPLKVLIWSDSTQTKVTYLTPQGFAARHNLTQDLGSSLSGIDALTDELISR
jgi:uncharacterized protein (DUF302 family)